MFDFIYDSSLDIVLMYIYHERLVSLQSYYQLNESSHHAVMHVQVAIVNQYSIISSKLTCG